MPCICVACVCVLWIENSCVTRHIGRNSKTKTESETGEHIHITHVTHSYTQFSDVRTFTHYIDRNAVLQLPIER